MIVFSSIISIMERITTDRAHSLGQAVEANQAFAGANSADRLTKMEDLSFLSVTMFA